MFCFALAVYVCVQVSVDSWQLPREVPEVFLEDPKFSFLHFQLESKSEFQIVSLNTRNVRTCK